jgi:hypothetical protein
MAAASPHIAPIAQVDRSIHGSVDFPSVMCPRLLGGWTGWHPGRRSGRAGAALLTVAAWLSLIAPPTAWSADDSPGPTKSAPADFSATGFEAVRQSLGGSTEGISADPGAVNVLTGTGLLGRLLGFWT